MPFSIVFQLCHCGQCTCPCLPGVLIPVLCKILFPILGKNTGQARGWNQQSPVLKSCTLPTELWGSVSALCINGLTHYQTTNFRLVQIGSLQTTILNLKKIAESSLTHSHTMTPFDASRKQAF